MDRIAYADESNTHSGTRCYGIGALHMLESHIAHFEAMFDSWRVKHNVTHELKWENIGSRFSDINLILDVLDYVLTEPGIWFDMIVVDTSKFNLWNQVGADRVTAFYKTYAYLLTSIARKGCDGLAVFIDERSESPILNTMRHLK